MTLYIDSETPIPVTAETPGSAVAAIAAPAWMNSLLLAIAAPGLVIAII
jgi:hypothetical protein